MFQNFKNQWLGRRIDFDHVFGYQCVDLILQYLYQLGITHARGNAIDYWRNTSPEILNKFHKVEGSDAQQGDIVVLLSGDPNGHVGIATGNINGSQVEILEQNGGGGADGLSRNGRHWDEIGTRWVSRAHVVGLLRLNEAPAAPAPAPAPVASHAAANVGRVLVLPGSVSSWRVYHLNGPWTVGHEVAKLNPQEFGGLEYQIKGNPANNIYEIHTGMFGEVAIYAGPDTEAQFKDGTANAPVAPAPAPTPPPAPEPHVEVVPAPAPTPKPANITYSKLDAPLNLVVNKTPTHKWDLSFVNDAHATSVEDIAVNTPFVAYGKAQRTDGDKPCYYMAQGDFGNADTTGIPVNNYGVNTVDLSPPPPAPVVEPSVASVPAAPVASGDTIPVKVLPANPNKWQESFVKSLGPIDYTASEDVTVKDLAGVQPDQKLVKDQPFKVGGVFEKDGQRYYRTVTSCVAGTWYGIPVKSAKAQDKAEDKLLDLLWEEADELRKEMGLLNRNEKISQARQKLIESGATIDGFFTNILHRKKN